MFAKPIAVRLATHATGLAVAVLFVVGCQENGPTVPGTESASTDRPQLSSVASLGDLDPDVRAQVLELRRATARYHDIGQAKDDGWNVRFPEPCLAHSELGGMGLHFLNAALLDGDVEVTEPEFLVYEPGPQGTRRLVAAEYVVPFDIAPAAGDPPTLFGQHFHANQTFGVWALHVWAWRHNPRGVFAEWNQEVSCEHADLVRTFPEE